jgi:DNA-binding transcriptional MerR regulator
VIAIAGSRSPAGVRDLGGMGADDTVESGQVAPLRRGRALLYGVATMLDFTGALSRGPRTQSADEDMAVAWQEVLGVRSPSPGIQSDDGAAAPGSGSSEPSEIEASYQPLPPTIGKGGSSARPDVETMGFPSRTAHLVAGISPRQLDYWARTGLVVPSIRPASGPESPRIYGFIDIVTLKVVKRLLDTGISLQQARAAIDYLRDQGVGDIRQVTLMSDGASVYACRSPDEVVQLLQGGQGVFGIALGRVWQEVEGALADLVREPSTFAEPDRSTGREELPERRRDNRAG